MKDKSAALKNLRTIPGVGEIIAEDLWQLGFREVSDFCGQDPEMMYHKYCDLRGQPIDRCVLYVLRCAVYFSETKGPEPELLKWWNWTDERMATR